MINFRIKLFVGILFVWVMSSLIGYTSYYTFSKQENIGQQVANTYKVINAAQNAQKLLIDMETGRRGFRATNEKRFLEPYNLANEKIDPAIEKIKKLVTGNIAQEKRSANLQTHSDSLRRFWYSIGYDIRIYTPTQIIQITDDEKRQMDEIRAIIDGIILEEQNLLLAEDKENNMSIHYAMLSASIGTILVQCIIGILIVLIVLEFNKRRKIMQELHESNLKLMEQEEILRASDVDLKKALNSVEATNTQLEKFVYTVAHDIKSPLSGIIGINSILKIHDNISEDAELTELIDLSINAANYLCHRVDSILELSRTSIDQQKTEEVNVKELIEKMIILLFPPHNIKILTDGPMPVVKATKLKMEQVFQNLLSNAIKYNDKKNGLIKIGCVDKGKFYEFRVADNGQGVSEEDATKVFKASKTGSNKSIRESSTGFGLHIVKQIVEEQGGRIWFDSTVGNGTTFYFEWNKL